MSENHSTPSRRTVLKKTGAASSILAGLAAPSSAQVETQGHTKDHWIEFSTDATGDQDYKATLPDDSPYGENLESEDMYSDCGTDCSEVFGTVSCTFAPCYDAWHFNGDTSEVTYVVENGVDVVTSW